MYVKLQRDFITLKLAKNYMVMLNLLSSWKLKFGLKLKRHEASFVKSFQEYIWILKHFNSLCKIRRGFYFNTKLIWEKVKQPESENVNQYVGSKPGMSG